jgi:hypothetical protein
MANLRFEVVAEAFKKKPLDVIAPVERPSEYFRQEGFQPCQDVQISAALMSIRSLSTLSTTVPHWTVLSLTQWLKA